MASKQKKDQKINQRPPVAKAPVAVKQVAAATTSPGEAEKVLADKWLIIILVAVAFLVNAATIRYGYTLDDPYFTRDNPLVKEGVSNIPEFFKHAAYYGVFKNHDASYRPFMLISFAIEKQFFGFDPQIGHTINLILFCLQIVCLFLLFRRIFSAYSAWIPFFIILLFELHPIHTEVVASIKSRDELLALLFTAISVLQSFKYIDSNKMKHLILSGVYFFLALMSKESSITFVAIMPLTVYFFRNESMKKIVTAVVPYIVVAGIYMMMRAAFIESDGEKVRILVNNNLLMAATNYGDKLATLLFIQLKYIMLLFFPHPLSYDYSYNQIPILSFANPKALLSFIIIVGLLGYALFTLKKKNIFSYCILFYFGGAVITSNLLVDIGSAMGERFIYTASMGFCIALVFLVVKLLKSDAVKLSYATAPRVFMVLAGIAVLYSVKTIARNEVWKDNLVLYENGVETAPDSWRSHYLLAVEYTKMLNKETNPAVKKELFEKAIANYNMSGAILPFSADVLLLKGYAFDFAGHHEDSALACYRTVLLVDSTNKQAANNLGAVLLRKGNFPEAIKVLRPVVMKDSTYTDALGNLAAAYGNSGDFNDAIKYYLQAIRINPNQPPNVFVSLTNIYRIMGDSAKSKYYNELLKKSQQNTQAPKE